MLLVVCLLYGVIYSDVSPFVCLRIFLCCASYWLRVRDLFLRSFVVIVFGFVDCGLSVGVL